MLPAILACGLSFAAVQFYVSNYMGPELTDILSSLTCIVVMVLVLKFWKPKTIMRLEGDIAVSVTLTAPHGRRGVHGLAAVPAAGGVRADLGRAVIKRAINRFDRQPAAGFLTTCRGTGR